MHLKTITLRGIPPGKLGLRLEEAEDGSVAISYINEDSPVTGSLSPGDHITNINGVDVHDGGLPEISTLFQQLANEEKSITITRWVHSSYNEDLKPHQHQQRSYDERSLSSQLYSSVKNSNSTNILQTNVEPSRGELTFEDPDDGALLPHTLEEDAMPPVPVQTAFDDSSMQKKHACKSKNSSRSESQVQTEDDGDSPPLPVQMVFDDSMEKKMRVSFTSGPASILRGENKQSEDDGNTPPLPVQMVFDDSMEKKMRVSFTSGPASILRRKNKLYDKITANAFAREEVTPHQAVTRSQVDAGTRSYTGIEPRDAPADRSPAMPMVSRESSDVIETESIDSGDVHVNEGEFLPSAPAAFDGLIVADAVLVSEPDLFEAELIYRGEDSPELNHAKGPKIKTEYIEDGDANEGESFTESASGEHDVESTDGEYFGETDGNGSGGSGHVALAVHDNELKLHPSKKRNYFSREWQCLCIVLLCCIVLAATLAGVFVSLRSPAPSLNTNQYDLSNTQINSNSQNQFSNTSTVIDIVNNPVADEVTTTQPQPSLTLLTTSSPAPSTTTSTKEALQSQFTSSSTTSSTTSPKEESSTTSNASSTSATTGATNTAQAQAMIPISDSGNDKCEDARVIAELPTFFAGSTDTATPEFESALQNTCGVSLESKGVWYSLPSSSRRIVRLEYQLTTNAGGDSLLSVFTGSCDNLVCVYNAKGPSTWSDLNKIALLEFLAEIGETYLFLVSGENVEIVGQYTLKVSEYEVPSNDQCDTAAIVNPRPNLAALRSGTTVGATPSFDAVTPTSQICETDWYTRGSWFSILGKGSNVRVEYQLYTDPDLGDSELSVFEGSCDDLICKKNVKGPKNLYDKNDLAVLEFLAVKGQVYSILLSGENFDTAGDFEIWVTEYEVPSNDRCEDALAISTDTLPKSFPGSTDGATFDFSLSNQKCGGVADDSRGVWYSFVGNGKLTSISFPNPSDESQTSLFSGPCDALTCEQDWEGSSSFQFIPTLAKEYRLFLTDKSSFEVVQYEPPNNDLCTNAIQITTLPFLPDDGNLKGATTDFDEGSTQCGFEIMSFGGVWYTFVGTGNNITASFMTSNADWSELILFKGPCSSLECIASVTGPDENAVATLESVVTLKNAQYYLYLAAADDQSYAEIPFGLTVTATDSEGAEDK